MNIRSMSMSLAEGIVKRDHRHWRYNPDLMALIKSRIAQIKKESALLQLLKNLNYCHRKVVPHDIDFYVSPFNVLIVTLTSHTRFTLTYTFRHEKENKKLDLTLTKHAAARILYRMGLRHIGEVLNEIQTADALVTQISLLQEMASHSDKNIRRFIFTQHGALILGCQAKNRNVSIITWIHERQFRENQIDKYCLSLTAYLNFQLLKMRKSNISLTNQDLRDIKKMENSIHRIVKNKNFSFWDYVKSGEYIED